MVSMFFIFVIIDDIIMVLDKMLTMPMTARMLGKEEDLPKEGDVDAAVLALVRSSLIMVVDIATKVLIFTIIFTRLSSPHAESARAFTVQ